MTSDLPNLPSAYQLKVVLTDSEPEIWRRILVPQNITLAQLHQVSQQAMGWENLHDYRFQIGLASDKVECSPQQSISEVLASAQEKTFYYTYDAASGWLHRIEAEALEVKLIDQSTSASEAFVLPVCIDGAMACPPEGTGGVWGYDDFLDRLEDPNDPDYLTLIEKYGAFDPDAFDVSVATARLQQV